LPTSPSYQFIYVIADDNEGVATPSNVIYKGIVRSKCSVSRAFDALDFKGNSLKFSQRVCLLLTIELFAVED